MWSHKEAFNNLLKSWKHPTHPGNAHQCRTCSPLYVVFYFYIPPTTNETTASGNLDGIIRGNSGENNPGTFRPGKVTPILQRNLLFTIMAGNRGPGRECVCVSWSGGSSPGMVLITTGQQKITQALRYLVLQLPWGRVVSFAWNCRNLNLERKRQWQQGELGGSGWRLRGVNESGSKCFLCFLNDAKILLFKQMFQFLK